MKRFKKSRKSLRCQTWNYASKGWYFLTFTAVQRLELFGTLIDGEVKLSPIGEIIMHEWFVSVEKRPHMRFESIVVMPEHVHMMVYIRYRSIYSRGMRQGRFGHRLKRSISSFVGQFKATCTTKSQSWHEGTLWIRNYDDQRPCTPPHIAAVLQYIKDNPMRAQEKRNTPHPRIMSPSPTDAERTPHAAYAPLDHRRSRQRESQPAAHHQIATRLAGA